MESPSLKRSNRKTDRSGDANVWSLISSADRVNHRALFFGLVVYRALFIGCRALLSAYRALWLYVWLFLLHIGLF